MVHLAHRNELQSQRHYHIAAFASARPPFHDPNMPLSPYTGPPLVSVTLEVPQEATTPQPIAPLTSQNSIGSNTLSPVLTDSSSYPALAFSSLLYQPAALPAPPKLVRLVITPLPDFPEDISLFSRHTPSHKSIAMSAHAESLRSSLGSDMKQDWRRPHMSYALSGAVTRDKEKGKEQLVLVNEIQEEQSSGI